MGRQKPTVRLRELGLALKRAVEAKGMTRTDLARWMGWSESKVSRMFNGQRGANGYDVAAVLAVCGIGSPKREELIQLAERAHEPGWWQEYGDRLPPELTTLSDYEDAAIIITSFENAVVPGLLQTPGYMRLLMYRTPAIAAKEIPDRIEARIRRQQILDRRYAAKFVFFLDEYALTRTGPGRDIMSEQVHHILRMTVRNHVEIRMVPDSAGFHAAQNPFKLMEFIELNRIVFIETLTSALFLERPDTVQAYNRIVANLDNVALDEEHSRAWLAELATELSTRREEHDEHTSPLEEEFPNGLD